MRPNNEIVSQDDRIEKYIKQLEDCGILIDPSLIEYPLEILHFYEDYHFFIRRSSDDKASITYEFHGRDGSLIGKFKVKLYIIKDVLGGIVIDATFHKEIGDLKFDFRKKSLLDIGHKLFLKLRQAICEIKGLPSIWYRLNKKTRAVFACRQDDKGEVKNFPLFFLFSRGGRPGTLDNGYEDAPYKLSVKQNQPEIPDFANTAGYARESDSRLFSITQTKGNNKDEDKASGPTVISSTQFTML